MGSHSGFRLSVSLLSGLTLELRFQGVPIWCPLRCFRPPLDHLSYGVGQFLVYMLRLCCKRRSPALGLLTTGLVTNLWAQMFERFRQHDHTSSMPRNPRNLLLLDPVPELALRDA
jgi:hypothetical protein